MQTVSQTYSDILTGPHWAEYRLAIYSGVNRYIGMTNLVSMTVSGCVFSGDSPGIGGCNAGEIDAEFIAPAFTIPRMARIQPMVRICNENAQSEWLPKGLYYIDTRETGQDDPRTLRLHGYDAMLKAEEIFPSTSQLSFPAKDADVVRLIAEKLGLAVDARTWEIIAEAGGYTIPLPVSYTMREVLGYIGVLYAGNWIISDNNELRLVALAGIPRRTSLILANSTQPLTFGRGDDETAILIRASEGGGGDESATGGQTAVGRRYETLETSPPFAGFSRVVLTVNDSGDAFVSGDDTGRTLTCFCPWGTQAKADGILRRIRGFAYQPFEAENALLEPAAELGDGVELDDVYSGICRREIKFDPVLASDIAAPEEEEIDHEYAWEDPQTRAWQRAASTNRAAITLANDRITAEVTARTDADNALSSRITQTAEDITAEVTARTTLEGAVTDLASTLSIQADEISAKVSQNGDNGRGTFAWSLTSSGFYINNGTVKKDGSDLLTINRNGMTVRGKIQAETGYIGGNNGFTIQARKLYSGTHSSMDSEASGVYIGTDGISLGKNVRVTSAGKITARDITVTSGTFSKITLDGVTLRGEINNSGGRVSGGSYSGGSFSGAFAGAVAMASDGSTVDGESLGTWVGDIVAGKITADYINALYAQSGTLEAAYVNTQNLGTGILNVGFGGGRKRASWQSATFVNATKYVYGSVTINGTTYPVVLGSYVGGASPIPVPDGYGTISYLGG